MTTTEFERRANEEYVSIWSKMYDEMIEREPQVDWNKLDPEIQEKVKKHFRSDKKPRRTKKGKGRPKNIIHFNTENKPFVRPKAEYSNRSPYGIATELLNYKD